MDNKKTIQIPRYLKAFITKDRYGKELDFKIPYYCEVVDADIDVWDSDDNYVDLYKTLKPVMSTEDKVSFVDELISKKVIKHDVEFYYDAVTGKHKLKKLTKEDEEQLESILKELN